jgi:hypothetical protein
MSLRLSTTHNKILQTPRERTIVITYFFVAVTKIPDINNVREKFFIFIMFSGHHSRKNTVEQRSSHHGRQEAEKNQYKKGPGQDIGPKDMTIVT